MQTKPPFPSRFLAVALFAVMAGLALSGCDDHVTVERDPSVAVKRGMTWAWRPAAPPPAAGRRVLSRDSIATDREPNPNPQWENDIVRNRIAKALEQNMNAKGLLQVSDPAQADFLADYQFGVQRRRERVASPVYPSGLVCGYYGCWNGFYGPPGVVVRTIQYHEGTIVFDVVAGNGNRLAYRGVRENVVHQDSFTQEEINEGAKHLLNGLKPSK